MTHHAILKRWEDNAGAHATCSCGEQFSRPHWVLRSVDIADHKKAAKAQALPVRHAPAVIHAGGTWSYLRCPCGWSSVVRGFDHAETVASAHRQEAPA